MGKATTIRMMLTLAASLAITACGFHLRGSYEMPAGLHALTLTTPGSSAALRDELALTLGRAHVSTDGGDTELEVTRELLTKQTTTVDSRAKAAEYTLIYSVDYRLQPTGSWPHSVTYLATRLSIRHHQYCWQKHGRGNLGAGAAPRCCTPDRTPVTHLDSPR